MFMNNQVKSENLKGSTAGTLAETYAWLPYRRALKRFKKLFTWNTLYFLSDYRINLLSYSFIMKLSITMQNLITHSFYGPT
jgi:hypothetical protein